MKFMEINKMEKYLEIILKKLQTFYPNNKFIVNEQNENVEISINNMKIFFSDEYEEIVGGIVEDILLPHDITNIYFNYNNQNEGYEIIPNSRIHDMYKTNEEYNISNKDLEIKAKKLPYLNLDEENYHFKNKYNDIKKSNFSSNKRVDKDYKYIDEKFVIINSNKVA